MAKKKGNPVAVRLKDYREALDQIRHLFPDLRLTPLCFFEEWWTDRCMPPPGLSKAADFFGLDLSKSEQRALLLDILADVIFGEQKKGRPPAKKAKWDRLRLIQLAVDCNKVKAETPGISDKKAASIIKHNFSNRYKHASAEMIRQYLADARIWLENENRIRADRGVAPLTSVLTSPIFSIDRSYFSDR
jgi:hypothetical protein